MTLDEAMTIVRQHAYGPVFQNHNIDRFVEDWRRWLETNKGTVDFDDIGQIKTMRLANELGKPYHECRRILTRLGVQLRDY